MFSTYSTYSTYSTKLLSRGYVEFLQSKKYYYIFKEENFVVKEIIKYAIKNNDLYIFKILSNSGVIINYDFVIEESSVEGNLDIIRIYYKKSKNFKKNINILLLMAVGNGHLHILKFFKNETLVNRTIVKDLLISAIYNKNRHILYYIIDNYYNTPRKLHKINNIIVFIAQQKLTFIIITLIEKYNLKPFNGLFIEACGIKNFSLVKYLLRYNKNNFKPLRENIPAIIQTVIFWIL